MNSTIRIADFPGAYQSAGYSAPAAEQKAKAVSDGAGVLEHDRRSGGKIINPRRRYQLNKLATRDRHRLEEACVDVRKARRLHGQLCVAAATATAARREGEENQLKRVDGDEDRVPADDVGAARDRRAPEREASATDAQRYSETRHVISRSS